ncbi:hypothetical protein BH24ACT15_BH24ACT15_16780 [soil metagenome]|jgi:DNA-binding MarR family transcriptional regulator
MTLDHLNPLLSNTKRLAALGVLAKSSEVEFVFLRQALGLSDSDLSKQMGALADADYLTTRKTGKGRNRKTWFKITGAGRKAIRQHISALNGLVHDAPNAPAPPVDGR